MDLVLKCPGAIESDDLFDRAAALLPSSVRFLRIEKSRTNMHGIGLTATSVKVLEFLVYKHGGQRFPKRRLPWPSSAQPG